MTRPRPIIVGFVALSVLVIGVEVYGLFRSRRRAPSPVADEPTPAESPLAAAPPPAIVAPPPAPPPAPRTVSPAPVPDSASGTLATQTAARDATMTARPPLFVAPNLQEVIRDADEQAFETLKMPETTRAAIRRINEDHAKRVQALRDGAPSVASDQQPAIDKTNVETNVEASAGPTRRASLDALLGPDAAQQFDAAEHAATKRLHNRYRWQSLHGVAPGTPPPDVRTIQH